MIPWIGGRWRWFNRWFDRAYWALRVLPFAKQDGPADSDAPGLILIQIDGLSQPQFQRALAEGRMPFLKRLIKREKYVQHTHYSGVPSTTPAVQGELFYGVRGCVPVFHFKDKETGRVFRMYEPSSASEIERRLAASGNAPLLEGGSSYSNIFCGGAAESHYCAAGIGWKTLFKTMNPMSWPMLILFHSDIFIRTFFLAVLEFFISMFECVRGALQGKGWAIELQFVLMRVIACVYLRELTVLGGRIDIARGLPIIHLNFFGYDEQSHRRGPTSEFAHWSLQGIDSAIARVYRQAMTAKRRDYDVWMYSDHGQEGTEPYFSKYGRRIDEAVAEVFEETPLPTPPLKGASHRFARNSAWAGPTCCVHGPQAKMWTAAPALETDKTEEKKENEVPRVLVTGMGPLAHIYPPTELSEEAVDRVVLGLLEKAKAPMVLVPLPGDPGRRVRVHTLEGQYLLPDDGPAILADNHLFVQEATQDLMNLCHHPNSGRIILSGWKKNQPPQTFPLENGSHAGFGPNETNGFALLPSDAPVRRSAGYLRPTDIRAAALRFLGRPADKAEVFEEVTASGVWTGTGDAPPPTKLRVMTYNVHGCVGMDGKLSPDRIARLIARHDPDVVALQELDVCRRRSRDLDQVKIISEKLKMNFHFHAAICVRDEQYGNAILSRYPMRLVRAESLPRSGGFAREPRGALWVELDLGGQKIQFLNTHLSIWRREGFLQASALQSLDWLQNAACSGPRVILCGDFNASPHSPTFNVLQRTLRDVQMVLEGHRPHKTLPAFYPISRIDHVFIGSGFRPLSVEVPRTQLERISSDHLPLIVELQLIPSA